MSIGGMMMTIGMWLEGYTFDRNGYTPSKRPKVPAGPMESFNRVTNTGFFLIKQFQ
jgi:hypothetical protein